MFPLSFSEERNFRDCSPSRSSSSMDERSSKALEAMLREHDNDSIITESSLPKIRAIYRIPDDFDLYVPEAGQHPFDPFPNGFNLSVNTLEGGLRFPLHSLVISCLRHWRISPSRVAPNNMITFIGECRVAQIEPTLTLFLTFFRLGKGRESYYLIAWSGFRVCGAPSNNKG
ncbi:hypothetical protein GW17_00024244 [Ensete ventricosum]|nr:hypothetical protein GW17_00024244 [Ensete ventricosum]